MSNFHAPYRVFLYVTAMMVLRCLNINGQTNSSSKLEVTIANLEQSILENSSDSLRAVTFNQLSWELHRSDLEKSHAYAKLSEEIALHHNYQSILARSYNLQGLYYSFKDQYSLAESLNEKGFEIAQEIQDSFLLGEFYNDLGLCYLRDLSRLDKASEYLHKSMKYCDEQDTLGKVIGKLNLRELYWMLKDSAKEDQMYHEVLDLASNCSDPFVKGVAYNYQLEKLEEGGDLDTIIDMNQKIIDIHILNQDYFELAESYSYHSWYFQQKQDYSKARSYLDSSINLSIEKGFLENLPYYRFYLAELDYEMGHKKRAIDSMVVAKNQMKSSSDKLYFIELLSEYYEEMGDLENALSTFREFHTANDSIISFNSKNIIEEYELLYEAEKREKENQRLKNERLKYKNELQRTGTYLSWTFLLLILISALLWLYYYLNDRKKKFNEELQFQVNQKTSKLNQLNNEMEQNNTALEKLNHTLLKKNKELEQYTFISSHDLEEPLKTIRTYAQILDQRYSAKLDEVGKKSIEFMIGSANRMSQLIKGLLDYSRLGKESSFEWVNCDVLLKELLLDMHASIKDGNAAIKINKMPTILASKIELRLLFQNLIGNAIKFRSPCRPCQIEITSSESEDHWVFKVADNGIGIAEKNKEKIFEVFKRLHGQDKYSGSGIGLSHCRKITEIHQGRIWIESNVGEGSDFYFTISKNLTT